MFDKFRLKEVLVQYKRDLPAFQWKNEQYKWEAIKCFQDNWDINAADFAEMLTKSLSKTYNLLASMNNFPSRMIIGFAKTAPEDVRGMFIALFDETKDYYERMKSFKDQSSIMLERFGNGAAQHYQYENAISVYLWLRYPEKYYSDHLRYVLQQFTSRDMNIDYVDSTGKSLIDLSLEIGEEACSRALPGIYWQRMMSSSLFRMTQSLEAEYRILMGHKKDEKALYESLPEKVKQTSYARKLLEISRNDYTELKRKIDELIKDLNVID